MTAGNGDATKMMSRRINFTCRLSESCCRTGGGETDNVIAGHDNSTFRVVDCLEAKPTFGPCKKSYDLPGTGKMQKGTQDKVQVNPQSPS